MIKRIISVCFVYFLFIISPAVALPWVIAHRGGGQNFPENTLLAFSKALEMGCDALELDVQVTKDGVVVVYHPADLKQWTNGSGSISEHYWEEITDLDAGYNFKQEENYPFRGRNLRIPTLEQVLELFSKTLIIIDMKSLPADALVRALIETISDEDAERLIFYSTNEEHLEMLSSLKPHWKTFERRDMTRQRLLELNQTGHTEISVNSNWIGFELKRKMMITETFALGQGTSSVEFHLWSPEVVSYLRSVNPSVFLILFGINTRDEWDESVSLGVDAIYTDNPYQVVRLKNARQGVISKDENYILD